MGVTRSSFCRAQTGPAGFGVEPHRAELEERERASVLADALLAVEHSRRPQNSQTASAVSAMNGAATTIMPSDSTMSAMRLIARRPRDTRKPSASSSALGRSASSSILPVRRS